MNKKTFFCISIFLAAAFGGFAGEAKFTCAYSHEQSDLFFVADDEGYVTQCRNDGFERIQRSILPIRAMTVCQFVPLAATYATDGIMTRRISVWDFEANEELCSVEIDGDVLCMAFSPKGNFLMVCGNFAGAIKVFRIKDMMEQYVATKGLSDVLFAMMNEQENTLVTYSAQGELTYFNVFSGKAKTKLPAEKGLSEIFALKNNTAIFGAKENLIYKVKTSNGETEFSAEAQNGASFISGNSLMTFYESQGELTLLSNAASATGEAEISPVAFFPSSIGGLRFAQKTKNFVFLASDDKISVLDAAFLDNQAADFNGESAVFTPFDYSRIIDFAQTGEKIFILTQKELLFADYQSGASKTLMYNEGCENICASGDKVVLWTKNSAKSAKIYALIDGELSLIKEIETERPFSAIEINGEIFSSIDEAKKVFVYDISQEKEVFSIQAADFETMVANSETVFIGKTRTSQPPVPMVSYNYRLPVVQSIKTPGEITIRLAMCNSNIYGLACKNVRAANYSAFLFNPKIRNSLQSFEISSDFEIEPAIAVWDNYFYCNSATYTPTKLDFQKNTKKEMPRLSGFPQKLAASKDMLFALTTSGILGFYDSTTDLLLAEWKILPNGKLQKDVKKQPESLANNGK